MRLGTFTLNSCIRSEPTDVDVDHKCGSSIPKVAATFPRQEHDEEVEEPVGDPEEPIAGAQKGGASRAHQAFAGNLRGLLRVLDRGLDLPNRT